MIAEPPLQSVPGRASQSRRWLRGVRFLAARLWSNCRLLKLRCLYDGLSLHGVHISRGCEITVGRGGRLEIRNCHLAPGVTISVGRSATMGILADYIGPNAVIVARQSIHIGEGSKLAEMVVVRDANHDHRVPLKEMCFVAAPIVVGEDVWVGARSTILKGVSVGSRSTIGAGAVVTSDVAAGTTVIGIPARPVS